MICHAYVLTWVGLLLMQHLGLAPTMSLIITWGFKEKFCSCDFWCMDFWVVTGASHGYHPHRGGHYDSGEDQSPSPSQLGP